MSTLFLLLLILLQHDLATLGGSSILGPKTEHSGEVEAVEERASDGRIGGCAAVAAEEGAFEVGYEGSRRVMEVQRRYISYETLRRGMVPCGIPGASYYNCGPTDQANRYSRGCAVITRCVRSITD